MKKINIKYKVAPSKKDEEGYTVQCQVVFNRTNTKFFAHFFKKSILFPEEFVKSASPGRDPKAPFRLFGKNRPF